MKLALGVPDGDRVGIHGVARVGGEDDDRARGEALVLGRLRLVGQAGHLAQAAPGLAQPVVVAGLGEPADRVEQGESEGVDGRAVRGGERAVVPDDPEGGVEEREPLDGRSGFAAPSQGPEDSHQAASGGA